MTDTVVSGLKTYGEIRTRIGVIIAMVTAICFCIFGWVIVMTKDTHTSKTTGILSDVNCSSNTCTATASYGPFEVTYLSSSSSSSPSPSPSPSPRQYKLMANWPIGSKNGDVVDVYYNPANPADAVTGPVPKWAGWAFIGVATFMILCSFLFMKFFSGLSNQGKAVVGGFQAAHNASSFFGRN